MAAHRNETTYLWKAALVLQCALLLAGCDGASAPVAVHKETAMPPLTDVNPRLAFTCQHQTIPEPSADSDVLFHYARWLQKNNQLPQDETVDTEVGRLYRIAAENGHAKATINLLNGSLRGHFNLNGEERLRFAQRLIDQKVAAGYYFVAIYLQHGAAGLEQDEEMALRYYRKAADEGNPQAQAYVAEKLFRARTAYEVVEQMEYCAAEQGESKAAKSLGVYLQIEQRFQEAMEVFQLGVAAGDSVSAGFLEKGFNGPEPNNGMYYMGLQKDPERFARYNKIRKILSGYSYASPTVPEINDIVPLPPAPLPPWDGKLKWLEEREANIPPPKPSEALIAELAKKKQLNPQTGRPLPASPDFNKDDVALLLCRTGEPCPKSGYWQIAWIPYDSMSQEKILYLREGDIMPTETVRRFIPRPWPLRDRFIEQQQPVEWRFLGEA